jgi:hypothetical protein
VSAGDLLTEAVEELYSSAPEEFIERRAALAAQARAAGQASMAKGIASLRKPTRSAWVLNQLVRAAPGVGSQLAQLGADLRAAQSSLDGARIRELSVRRRRMIDALTRQAFTVSGQLAPQASVTDEVTSTLGAALADPKVAERLQAGTLERAARSDGSGLAGTSDLDLVPPSTRNHDTLTGKGAAAPVAPVARAAKGAAAAVGSRPERGNRQATADAERERRQAAADAERERRQAVAEAERKRRQAVAEAEQMVAAADQAASAAASAERNQESAIRRIQDQLAAARSDLADARLQARQAMTRQRQAHQALDRLRK